jgi:hypothetical protein
MPRRRNSPRKTEISLSLMVLGERSAISSSPLSSSSESERMSRMFIERAAMKLVMEDVAAL